MERFNSGNNGSSYLQLAHGQLQAANTACDNSLYEGRRADSVRWESPAAALFRGWLAHLASEVTQQQVGLDHQIRALSR